MRYALYIIVALLALSGCKTAKPDVVVLTDTIRIEGTTKIISRIDTVRVSVPVPAEQAKNTTNEGRSHLETSVAFSDAWINTDGSLGHSLENKPTQLGATAYLPVTDTIKIYTTDKTKTKPVYVDKPLTWWQQIRLKAFWWLVGATILLLIFVTGKRLIRLLGFVL